MQVHPDLNMTLVTTTTTSLRRAPSLLMCVRARVVLMRAGMDLVHARAHTTCFKFEFSCRRRERERESATLFIH